MNLATKTNVSVGSWHRNSIKRTDLQCSTTYGYLTTNIRMVPALLVMQTTLGITLCNNLRDINLSIFESVPQVIFEVHSVHDLVLPAVLFCCHYWQKCCLRRWGVCLMLQSGDILAFWKIIRQKAQYCQSESLYKGAILIICAYQHHSTFRIDFE